MKKLLVLIAVTLTILLVGCGGEEEVVDRKSLTREATEETETKADAAPEKAEPDEEDKEDSEEAEEEAPEDTSKDKQEDETEAVQQPTEETPKTEAPNKPEEKPDEPSQMGATVDLGSLCQEIKSTLAVSGAMDLDAGSISGLYGINSSDMAQAVGFVIMEGTFPHEAVMIEAKDDAAADRVEALLNTKHQSFVAQSKGYDAENYALAQKCRVERHGNYVSMFLTPDFESMKAVYGKYVK